VNLSWNKRSLKSIVIRKGPLYNRFWLSINEHMPGVNLPIIVRDTGYSIWKKGAAYRRNTYSFLGIELVTAGDMLFEQHGMRFTVNSNQAFVKLPGQSHTYQTGPCGFAHKRFITIAGPKLQTIVEDLGLAQCMVVHLKNPGLFIALMRKAISLICCQTPGNNAELSALAYRILMELVKSSVHSEIPSPLSSALDYMRQNLNRSITIKELCTHANMSRAQFYRVFEQHMHISPLHYFERERMIYAQDLIASGDYPIKTIAHMLGFTNPFHFSVKFKKHAGISPRKYRQS
jgi:AraC-like DNA-binding protein